MSETKADTTSMGLFLISFLMLVLTLFGFLNFGDNPGKDALALKAVLGPVAFVVAIGFLFVMYAQWKNNNKFVMIIFGLLTMFTFLVSTNTLDSMYLFIVIAIKVIILALIALINKAGFMLTLLLLTSGLVFLFHGLSIAPDSNTMVLLVGVFALISFVLSTWMALADNTEIGLPVA
jgi:uncharacterized membrane protein HdeD (DUF308 family)